jgi:FkbM family methyltransferase
VAGELNRDCYELGQLPADKPLRIIDIGANIGMTACLMSRLFPAAKIECYEPHPVNHLSLTCNLLRNRAFNVTAYPWAAATRKGSFAMTIGENNTGGATGWTRGAQERAVETVEVSTITLPKILGGRPVDILKIDIEGAEHELLAGFNQWRWVDRLIIELHQNDFLAEQGYTIEKTEALIRMHMGAKPVVINYCNPMAQ